GLSELIIRTTNGCPSVELSHVQLRYQIEKWYLGEILHLGEIGTKIDPVSLQLMQEWVSWNSTTIPGHFTSEIQKIQSLIGHPSQKEKCWICSEPIVLSDQYCSKKHLIERSGRTWKACSSFQVKSCICCKTIQEEEGDFVKETRRILNQDQCLFCGSLMKKL